MAALGQKKKKNTIIENVKNLNIYFSHSNKYHNNKVLVLKNICCRVSKVEIRFTNISVSFFKHGKFSWAKITQ